MSKMSVVRRCYNCGAILQCEDEGKEGYIEPRLLEGGDETVLFCAKCWSTQRYNFAPRGPSISDDYLTMLQDAQASDSLIVYVVDLFSFESSFAPSITRQIEGLNILVIANKRDLLPESASDEELRRYVSHRFRMARLQVKEDDVILISLTSTYDVSAIREEIEKRRRRHDVYVIGAAAAGKTQLIYSFLRGYTNVSGEAVSTVYYPGTKIRVMRIPLDSSSYLYDTPGIPTDNAIQSKMNLDAARQVYPSEPVRRRNITLSQGDGIAMGGLGLLVLLKGNKQQVGCYFAPTLDLSKRPANKLAGGNGYFAELAAGAYRPLLAMKGESQSFDAFDIEVEEEGLRDIGIEGLGWFCFKGDKQTWRIFVPKGVAVYTTRSKVK